MAKERKLTGNIKGVVSKYSDNSFEFRPFGKGEPVYEEKQDFKNGVTIAKTRGVNGKKVVRLMLDNSDVDLFDACVKKLGEVLPEAPDLEPLRAKAMLLLGPDIQMVLDRKAGKVVVRMEVEVARCEKMQKKFFNLFNQINLCLAINKTTLTPVLN